MKEIKKLIIADDHEVVIIGIESLLKPSFNFEIDRVLDGEQLFQIAKEGNYDLVIADYLLPSLNGLDAIIKLKKIYPDLSVMLISSIEEDYIVDICKKENINAFVFKSDVKNNLVNAIEAIQKGESFYSNPQDLKIDYLWNHPSNPFIKLTKQELEIFKEMMKGRSQKETAESMNLTVKTIESHRMNLRKKLGLSEEELVKQARVWKII
ncbi:MAG: response regulator transcription factor [Leptospiraceae bacterium]|nr:response regulator transcription factor [Leptospiraceae bacterium]